MKIFISSPHKSEYVPPAGVTGARRTVDGRRIFHAIAAAAFLAFALFGSAAAQSDELFALYDRAMRCYELADYQNAEIYFSRVIKLSPESTYGTQSAFYLGRALIKLNREKEALAVWQAYYDKNMFIGGRAELFKLYDQFGLLEKKLDEFADKIKKAPDAFQHRHEYIEFLIYLNRVDEALAQYNYIISVRPRDFHLLKNAGDLLVRFKRYKEALYYYEKLMKMQPDNEVYLEAAGNAYFQLGDLKKAREYWFKIIESSLELHKYNTLANILQAHNMTDDAISVYLACRKVSGNPAIFFAELAELYEVKDDYKSLAQHYFGLIDRAPHMFTAVEQRLAETLKRNEDARVPLCEIINGELKKSVIADPQKLRLASIIFLMSSKYENALETNLLLSKMTSNPVILEDYARTLDSLELFDLSLSALDTIARAYQGGASEYNARFMKARFLAARGRYEEALRLFGEVRDDRRFSELYGESLYNTALIYFEGVNDRARALEIFDTLEVNASNYYYECLYFKGAQALYTKNLETADDMLNKVFALKDHRRSASAGALLAYKLVYQGTYEAAIDALRDILARYPSYEGAAEIFNDIKIIRAAQNDAAEDLAQYFNAAREFAAAHFATAEVMLDALSKKEGPLKQDAARLAYAAKLKLKKYDEFKKAVESYICAAKDDQSRAEAIYELARYYREREPALTGEAESRLETILKKYPGALLSNKSRKMLSAIKGDDKIEKKNRTSFFGYN